jgi:rubredoxin
MMYRPDDNNWECSQCGGVPGRYEEVLGPLSNDQDCGMCLNKGALQWSSLLMRWRCKECQGEILKLKRASPDLSAFIGRPIQHARIDILERNMIAMARRLRKHVTSHPGEGTHAFPVPGPAKRFRKVVREKEEEVKAKEDPPLEELQEL